MTTCWSSKSASEWGTKGIQVTLMEAWWPIDRPIQKLLICFLFFLFFTYNHVEDLQRTVNKREKMSSELRLCDGKYLVDVRGSEVRMVGDQRKVTELCERTTPFNLEAYTQTHTFTVLFIGCTLHVQVPHEMDHACTLEVWRDFFSSTNSIVIFRPSNILDVQLKELFTLKCVCLVFGAGVFCSHLTKLPCFACAFPMAVGQCSPTIFILNMHFLLGWQKSFYLLCPTSEVPFEVCHLFVGQLRYKIDSISVTYYNFTHWAPKVRWLCT